MEFRLVVCTYERQNNFVCNLDKGETEIPIPNVTSAVLERVLQYLQYHAEKPPKEIEKPIKSANMEEVVGDAWDAEFVNLPQDELFELILVYSLLSTILVLIYNIDI